MCVCGLQLIDMLDQRVKTQHDILVQCAVTSARTNEMQLESDVLRAKLAQLTYVNININVQYLSTRESCNQCDFR